MKVLKRFAVAATVVLNGVLALGQDITIKPDRPSGIYSAGEKVQWNIEIKGDATAVTDAHYRIKTGGLNVAKEGTLQFTDGKATVEATDDQPGWLLLEVDAKATSEKKLHRLGGAVFSPDQIRPAIAAPDDFDQFWADKIKELSAVPTDAVIKEAPSGKPNVSYYTITMDNIRGTHINGQLARPAKEGKFPALLIVQWAGVYPLEKAWVVDQAAQGWLALNIQAHDLPVAEPKKFYDEQSNGPLKDYPAIGNDDRETSYFLRMYLSCYRAAEYLTTRDDWDGKVLVVTGGSQGGLQTIVTAALHPKITGAMACVPAGCDNASLDAQRAPGWPMWPWQAKDKDPAKVKQAGRYFDVVNFASKVKCPILIGLGGIDQTCPPTGVYAAINQMTCPKEIIFMPLADHMGKHDAYNVRNWAWAAALKDGKPAPVK